MYSTEGVSKDESGVPMIVLACQCSSANSSKTKNKSTALKRSTVPQWNIRGEGTARQLWAPTRWSWDPEHLREILTYGNAGSQYLDVQELRCLASNDNVTTARDDEYRPRVEDHEQNLERHGMRIEYRTQAFEW